MVEMSKECRFPSTFDIPRPFTTHKTELPRKTELKPIKSPNGLVYPRVEVQQRTHSWDEIGFLALIIPSPGWSPLILILIYSMQERHMKHASGTTTISGAIKKMILVARI